MRIRIVTLAALAALATTDPVQAHVKTDAGSWLFTGSTYRDDDGPPDRGERADPISVVWRGPTGTDVTVRRAQIHTEEHWRERRIPSQFPRGRAMRPRTNPFCTDAQHVFYRDGTGVNNGRWAASTGYMSTNHLCGNQWHIRMWSSQIHGEMFGEAHRLEWVLAPMHHDRVVIRCRRTAIGRRCRPTHRGDVPWDQARFVYYRNIRPEHCVDPVWAVHPESDGHDYQGIEYSGIISRISFRHRSAGCD